MEKEKEETMIIYSDNTDILYNKLESRTDSLALRIKRMLALPNLTRKASSPLFFIVNAIINSETLRNADEVVIPEIVGVDNHFDLLGFDKNHPGRRPTDSFYVDSENVLRAHTTAMWSYYLKDEEVLKRLHKTGELTAYCYGKVYRNDEIDRKHYPVFHQIDGLRICRNSKKRFSVDDLSGVLVDIAESIFGKDLSWRITDDSFPFTSPSIQLEIKWKGEWIEVLGAGLVNPKVLSNLGLSPSEYNGWAFGFGLDRLAMIKMNIPDIRILWSKDERVTSQFTGINSVYHDVSNLPPVDRDVSFIADNGLEMNRFNEIARDCGMVDNEDIIEEVRLLEEYSNSDKFGEGKVSYTFRIRYRSHTRTLTNEEINIVQERVRQRVMSELGVLR